MPSHTHQNVERLQAEAQEALSAASDALASFAWLWPIRGILFCISHPAILLSVQDALVKSLVTSSLLFLGLAFFTFLPQMALLAPISGPLAPLLALVLVCAESIVLLTVLARALFLEPALSHVFDATLRARGQAELVRAGEARTTARGVGGAVVKPLQAFSAGGVLRYALTLPLNFVPMVGTIFFLLYNGHRDGPGWHQRYFQLKGLSKEERAAAIEKRRAEYTAFGMATLVFNFVPLAGLFFSFTNAVGAALWAAELEAEANLIDPAADEPTGSKRTE